MEFKLQIIIYNGHRIAVRVALMCITRKWWWVVHYARVQTRKWRWVVHYARVQTRKWRWVVNFRMKSHWSIALHNINLIIYTWGFYTSYTHTHARTVAHTQLSHAHTSQTHLKAHSQLTRTHTPTHTHPPHPPSLTQWRTPPTSATSNLHWLTTAKASVRACLKVPMRLSLYIYTHISIVITN